MPFYELMLVLKPLPKKELVECLKRTARLIWRENGALKRIEFLGFNKLPYKVRQDSSETKFSEGSYFLYHVSLNSDKLHALRPEIKLDLDILKSTWNLPERSDIPDNYECTLEEELSIPSFRPSLQPLLKFANVRAENINKLPKREYHATCRQESTIMGPGLMSIFQDNPKRLHRIQFLGQLFHSGGHEIRIAGGAVRDILLGNVPKDIDFATTALPEESLELLKKHEDVFRIIVTPAGQKHGTVAVKFKGLSDVNFSKLNIETGGGQTSQKPEPATTQLEKPEYDEESPFEITTLRCDRNTDGRHAEVEFINDWKLDAERRDLTINAMFLTIDKGELIDYFNGQLDLKNGIIRFVGDANQRIQEDYLRILRFFRFWSSYGQSIRPSDDTLNSISENIGGMANISGERVWVELKKIFSTNNCSNVVRLMLDLKVFEALKIFDELEPVNAGMIERDVEKVQKNIHGYENEILPTRTREELDDLATKKTRDLLPVICFSCILRSENSLSNAIARLKLSNLEKHTLGYLLRNRDNESMSLLTLKHHLVKSPQPDRLNMHLMIASLLIYQGELELLREFEDWQVPAFPLSGGEVVREADKLKIFNYHIKAIIHKLKELWCQSDFTMTKQELREHMFKEFDIVLKTLEEKKTFR